MRLGATTLTSTSAAFLDRAEAALDRRLSASSKAPLAVAFSGGGDSLALLLVAARWASARRRPLLALHVDHQLQPDSAAWAARCARIAAELGVAFQALSWAGEKPRTGLPAAARAARHRLIAEAARRAGGRVALFGHTADDLAEAAWMRAHGSTTPSPREWSPSPAWPEGRGLFLLRPLLSAGRAELRDWLHAAGWSWIDDPANEDPAYARARARRAPPSGAPAEPPPEEPAAAGLARACGLHAGDVLAVDRSLLRAARPEALHAFLPAAALCASGGLRPPRGARVAALAERLRGPNTFTATLAGARLEADAATLHLIREAGEARRGGLRPLQLPAGEPAVWDGRYELVAREPGCCVRALAGSAARLDPADRRRLAAMRPAARRALPLIEAPQGRLCLASEDRGLTVRFLGLERLRAACGAIEREPD